MRTLAENILNMKKFTFLLTLCSLLFIGCSDHQSFTLKGKVSGLASDTILVYYQVPEYKLDTLIAHKGAFEYTIHPDTFTMFSLVLNDRNIIPVFADKGEKVEWKGSADTLVIKGKGENKLMNDILEILRKSNTSSIQYYTDSLLQANPHSFTSIYLLDTYYSNSKFINYRRMEEQIEHLNGVIRDTPHMLDLQSRIKEITEHRRESALYTINLTDQFGRRINRNKLKDCYVLIDFWASGYPDSKAQEDTLASVVKALKKEPFRAISISLDMDKKAWKEAIAERDTTQWIQVCDFMGWNNDLIRNQDISSLPASMLLNPQALIVERDMTGQELIKRVKQLIKEDKERKRKQSKKKR